VEKIKMENNELYNLKPDGNDDWKGLVRMLAFGVACYYLINLTEDVARAMGEYCGGAYQGTVHYIQSHLSNLAQLDSRDINISFLAALGYDHMGLIVEKNYLIEKKDDIIRKLELIILKDEIKPDGGDQNGK